MLARCAALDQVLEGALPTAGQVQRDLVPVLALRR
jgi:hypothetical protein